jgi:hypothetical protein
MPIQIYAQKGEKRMKVRFLLSTVLVLTFVLTACAPQAASTKKAAEPKAAIPVTGASETPATSSKTSSKTTKNPTSGPAATSVTQTPGPAQTNDISMDDQAVKSGMVLVSMVDSLQPGWVAIFTDDNGQPGRLLGYTAVPAGTSDDIQVKVDSSSVTPKMIAMLLTDAGKIGTFEYPGADQPVRNAYVNQNVMAVFNRVSQ